LRSLFGVWIPKDDRRKYIPCPFFCTEARFPGYLGDNKLKPLISSVRFKSVFAWKLLDTLQQNDRLREAPINSGNEIADNFNGFH